MMKKLLHFALFAAMAVSGALAYASTNETGVGMATQATTSAGTSVQAIDSTLGSGGHAVMSKVAHKSDLVDSSTGGGTQNVDTSSVLAMTHKSGWSSLGSHNNVTSTAAGSMIAAIIGTTLLTSVTTHHGLSAGAAATSDENKFAFSTAGNYNDAEVT